MNSEAPIINLKNVDFKYPSGQTVLNQLNFKFFRGDRIGLIAPNGSGKTTLFHLIMGLNKPVSGQIELFGQPVTTAKHFEAVRRRIGLLFQDPDDQLFSPSVKEDVAFGPLNLGKSIEEAQEIVRRTLAYLGLEGFEDRITFKLSGGEKRLVSLATILAMEPEVRRKSPGSMMVWFKPPNSRVSGVPRRISSTSAPAKFPESARWPKPPL